MWYSAKDNNIVVTDHSFDAQVVFDGSVIKKVELVGLEKRLLLIRASLTYL